MARPLRGAQFRAVRNVAELEHTTGPTQARVYTHVNTHMPPSYWDVDGEPTCFGNKDDYEFRGDLDSQEHFSQLFLARHLKKNQGCVIKVPKRLVKRKIKREIKILQNLQHGPYIIAMHAVLGKPRPAIVFEHFRCPSQNDIFASLSQRDIRFFTFQIFQALNFTHSKGIMHRDVKPGNILINPVTRELRLIDWASADFYFPQREYSVRVGSFSFKAPELLLGYDTYDYSVDIWPVGCMLAAAIFRRKPFFKGTNNFEVLESISKILGTEDLLKYISDYQIVLDEEVEQIHNREYLQTSWQQLGESIKPSQVPYEAIHLIAELLKYDHFTRHSAQQAINHRYFDPVRHTLLFDTRMLRSRAYVYNLK